MCLLRRAWELQLGLTAVWVGGSCLASPGRIEERAAAEDDGGELQLDLRRLGRRLATVHQELSQYQQHLDRFRWGWAGVQCGVVWCGA